MDGAHLVHLSLTMAPNGGNSLLGSMSTNKIKYDNFENAERYDWFHEDVSIPEPESLWVRGKHEPIDQPQYGTSIGKRNRRRNMGDAHGSSW